MSESEYDKALCEDRHKRIDTTFNNYEEWLKRHDKEISDIKSENSSFKSDITTLFKKIDSLISTIKWGLGIFVTVALFILGYLIKKG